MKENIKKIFDLAMLTPENRDELDRLEDAVLFICSTSPESSAEARHLTTDEHNTLRNDTAVKGNLQKSILECAPSTENGYISVPKTVK